MKLLATFEKASVSNSQLTWFEFAQLSLPTMVDKVLLFQKPHSLEAELKENTKGHSSLGIKLSKSELYIGCSKCFSMKNYDHLDPKEDTGCLKTPMLSTVFSGFGVATANCMTKRANHTLG